MKLKSELFFLAFLLFLSACFAEKIFEQSLGGFGYSGFEVVTNSEEKCKEYAINIPDENGYLFLTIAANFLPSNKGTATIDCYINDKFLGSVNAKDFDCSVSPCVYYLPLSNNILSADSKLKFCLNPSQSITKIVLSNNSKIGSYLMGIFRQDEFKKCVVSGDLCVERYEAVIGEDLNVKIILKNSGNYEARALIYAVRPIVPDKNIRKELSELTFIEKFKPGEIKEFYYTVRAKSEDFFNLPPAATYYYDCFGRETIVFSNPVTIVPKEKPDVDAKILYREEGNKKIAQVIISNRSGVELNGVEVSLSGTGLIYEPEKQIFSIEPRNTKAVDFQLKYISSNEIGCSVKIEDYNMILSCNVLDISKKEINIVLIAIVGLILVAVAIGVYLYLNSLPE
ncbi:MAG: hypothetical protein N3F05_01090 [Candidatus Diapherotrites archaeon]|nr:hypothetical protein [Candidatus Diapherotrites archaeon]